MDVNFRRITYLVLLNVFVDLDLVIRTRILRIRKRHKDRFDFTRLNAVQYVCKAKATTIAVV
jgi:hypothetical protein